MKGYAREFYFSKAWRSTQEAYMVSQHYVCERCGSPARVVHHRTFITPKNIHDSSVTLDWANLEALCYDCHSKQHSKPIAPTNGIDFDENGNIIKKPNVFLVCGSPGSGKSTYVSKIRTNRDLVVDLDYICAALMGTPDQLYLDHTAVLGVALEVRETLYKIIRERRGRWERAFVVTSVANVKEQRAIARDINAEIVLIDTPLERCLLQLMDDKRRGSMKGTYKQLAVKWWADYTASTEIPSPHQAPN